MMAVRRTKKWTMLAGLILALATDAAPAWAQDFFSSFFGAFERPRAPAIQIPLGASAQQVQPHPRTGGGQAFCVRTCDGRHFPISGSDNKGRAVSCNSLCPSAETRVVYGSSIDNASTESGKPYADMPNAFRYRTEIVEGCSCNGKDAIGLARVAIENDPTLRKGDIVAGEDGLVVAKRNADRRGGSMEFSPASERIKARYEMPSVVASGRR